MNLQPGDIEYFKNIVSTVCKLSGSHSLISDIRDDLDQDGISEAVKQHDTAKLFSWFMTIFSFQGISDGVALSFIDRHGLPELEDIYRSVCNQCGCGQLRSYWHFSDCGYRKAANSCNNPASLSACPLPRLPLRNGRLNQTAFSFSLFLRDIARNDLVGWLESRIDRIAEQSDTIDRALIEPLSQPHGISFKVVRLALSELLLGARDHRWRKIGAQIVVVDSLVHNFLHRTGILRRLKASHEYGAKCYQPGGCVDALHVLATLVDARSFNQNNPSCFPRFVQKSIWSYCAQSELDICNGNQIDDCFRCKNKTCAIYESCDRIRLRRSSKSAYFRPI